MTGGPAPAGERAPSVRGEDRSRISPVHLELDEDDAGELREALDAVLRDLSHEIADTDNGSFRGALLLRRERLQRVLAALGG